MPLILAGALGIALLLARLEKGGAIYRFLVYFPVLVPGVVAGLIWLFLTNSDFGLFNDVLALFGFRPVTWLGVDTALGVLIALDVWRNVGYWAMFFVAAIIGLPQELYQAAKLDGASVLSRFRFLTLPLLRRIIFFAVVVSTIWAFQVFDTAIVLTRGGPAGATTTVIYRIWQYVFGSNNKVGFASAISLVMIVAILALTLLQMRLLRSRRGATDGRRGRRPGERPQGVGAPRRRSRPRPPAQAAARRALPPSGARHRHLHPGGAVLLRGARVAEGQQRDLLLSAEAHSVAALLGELPARCDGDELPALDVQHAVRRDDGDGAQGVPRFHGRLRARQDRLHRQARRLPCSCSSC